MEPAFQTLCIKSVLSQQARGIIPRKGILSSADSGIDKGYRYIYWSIFGISSKVDLVSRLQTHFNRFPASCIVRKGQFPAMFHFK